MFSLGCREGYKHCVGEANYHFQFTPKYRRPVFRDEVVKMACTNALHHIAGKLGVELHAVEFGPDHCHLFIGKCRRYSASKLAQRFKGASSRILRFQLGDRLHPKRTRDSLLLEHRILLRIGGPNNQRKDQVLHRATTRQTLDKPRTRNTDHTQETAQSRPIPQLAT